MTRTSRNNPDAFARVCSHGDRRDKCSAVALVPTTEVEGLGCDLDRTTGSMALAERIREGLDTPVDRRASFGGSNNCKGRTEVKRAGSDVSSDLLTGRCRSKCAQKKLNWVASSLDFDRRDTRRCVEWADNESRCRSCDSHLFCNSFVFVLHRTIQTRSCTTLARCVPDLPISEMN